MEKTNILIISGFLGSGKTTFIKKYIKDAENLEKTVIIENEFGEVSIDGQLLKKEGIDVKEINSGCICCSVSGSFRESILEIKKNFNPDTIIIEPSGVAKLSEIEETCRQFPDRFEILQKITVVDPSLYMMYTMNFGEFYIDQIKNSSIILFSRFSRFIDDGNSLDDIKYDIRRKNESTYIVEKEWDKFDSLDLIYGRIQKDEIHRCCESVQEYSFEEHEHEYCKHHEHHEHEHKCDCCEQHEHKHGHECCEHHEHEHKHECCEHHEHEHKHDCCEHQEHEHKHDCCEHQEHEHKHDCCEHQEHDHHSHKNDFDSITLNSNRDFSEKELENILRLLDNGEYGDIIRAKGSVKSESGTLQFNFVPGEINIEFNQTDEEAIFVIIGKNLKKEEIVKLF